MTEETIDTVPATLQEMMQTALDALEFSQIGKTEAMDSLTRILCTRLFQNKEDLSQQESGREYKLTQKNYRDLFEFHFGPETWAQAKDEAKDIYAWLKM